MEARLTLDAAAFLGAPLRFALGSSEPSCRARRPKGAAVVTRRLSSRGPGLLQRLLLPAARCLASSSVPALPSGPPEQRRAGHAGAAVAATRALGGGAVPLGPSAGIKAHGLRKGKGPRSPSLAPKGTADLRVLDSSSCLSLAVPANHAAVPLEEITRTRARSGADAGDPLSLSSRADSLRKRRQRAAVSSAAVLAPEAELSGVRDGPQCTGAAYAESDALYASREGGDAMDVDLSAEFEQMALGAGAVSTDDHLKGAQELLEHSWQLPAWPLGRESSAMPDVESFVSRLLKKRRSGKGERNVDGATAVPDTPAASPSRVSGGQRRLERVQQVLGAVASSHHGADTSSPEVVAAELSREAARRERVRRVLLAEGAVACAEVEASEDLRGEQEEEGGNLTAEDEQLQMRLADALSAAVAEHLDSAAAVDGTLEEGSVEGGEAWGSAPLEEVLGFADLEEEQDDVIVKFAEDSDSPTAMGHPGLLSPLSPSSIRGRRRSLELLRKRRSVELGQRERVLVRSMRKRRLSLGSRVGVKGQGSLGLDAGELAGEGEEIDAAEVDALLEGYGWRGDSKLEWDPTRRLLFPEEEKKIIGILEKGQKVKAIQALLQGKLGRDPTPAECAAEAQSTTSAVQRTLELFNAARNKLVMHNLGLVVSIARLYRSMGYGVDFDSLCQRGVKGLYAAADRFNSKRNCRFSTLASVCVRTVVTREIAASMHVRAPTYCSYKFMLMQRVSRELESKLRRRPTDEEVALACKMGVSQMKLIRKLFLEHPLHLHQEAAGTGLQMVEIVSQDGRDDDMEEKVAGTAEPESVRYALDDVIDSLKPKEAVVIRQRFGLDGYGERSMAEVGRNLSISREMVRKYEARALAKLQLQERADLFHSRLSVYSS